MVSSKSIKVVFSLAIIISYDLLADLCCARDVQFGYDETHHGGRKNWANLTPAYKLCGTGTHQSPVNILPNQAVRNSSLERLNGDYNNVGNGTLVINGSNKGINYTSTDSIVIAGKKYTLKQLRWHCPAEHYIIDESESDPVHPLEIQLLHESEDGNMAIVSILYKWGDADPFIDTIRDQLAKASKSAADKNNEEKAHLSATTAQFRSLKLNTSKYYRYVGSLTTPPCTENVIWNVLAEIRTLTQGQDGALLTALDGANARNPQPLNGRIVQVYDDMKKNKPN